MTLKELKEENEYLKSEVDRLEKELEKEKNCYIKLDEHWLMIKCKEADLMQRNSILECENKKLNAENHQLQEKLNEAQKNANATDVLAKMTYHF